MFVLTCMMLLSCDGNSGKEQGSSSDDGALADLGAEFMELFYNEPSEGDMKNKIFDEVMAEMEKKYPNSNSSNTSREKQTQILKEVDQEMKRRLENFDFKAYKEKWEKRVPELIEEMKSREIPTRVADNTPLKIMSPFKIKSIVRGYDLKYSCTAELTEDKTMQVVKNPCLSLVDANGNETRWPAALYASPLEKQMKAGTQIELEGSINLFQKDLLAVLFSAAYLEIDWNQFFLEGGKLGPVAIGGGYADLPKSVAGLYDKYDYKKETIEDEMDGDYTEEYYLFTKGNREVFRADIDGGKIVSITLLEGSSDIINDDGRSVGSLVSDLSPQNLEWENWYQGEVFATKGRYTYYVSSSDCKVEFPKRDSDFKAGAKISKIVCR